MNLKWKEYDLANLFRFPLRYFFISVMCLSVGLSNFQSIVIDKFKYGKIYFCLIFSLFLFENIVFNRVKFYQPFLSDNLIWTDCLKLENGKKALVANLPSKLLFLDRNEYIYMYEMSLHQQNTINGGSAFFSKERLLNDTLMSNYEKFNNLEKLIRMNHLDFIIVHKYLGGHNNISTLYPGLKLVYDDKNRSIYKVE